MKYMTKHDYLRFKRCPRLFAYTWNDYPKGLYEHNAVIDFFSNQGKKVGLLFQEVFKQHKTYTCAEKKHSMAILETKRVMPEVDIIFEGAFGYEKLFTRPDILKHKCRELIEVKSTSVVKEEHLYDAAFQKYVLQKCEVDIGTVKIGHINKSYVRRGELDLHELFTFTDVSEEVELKLIELEQDLLTIKIIMDDDTLPARNIGRHCTGDVVCPYKDVCWGNCASDSIFNLRRDVTGKKFDLHKAGVRSIKDIPDYVQLTRYQSLQKEAEIQSCSVIDHATISDVLKKIVYPIYFLDFETYSLAIPKLEMASPFQQIPSQASIHLLKGPHHKPKHFGFLHDKDSDPRYALTTFLLDKLGTSGTIVVYHASFEISRLYELIQVNPDKEAGILALIDRVWDLETIFEKGLLVHPGFQGSTSIKKVLPILCPELSYEGLEVDNGILASIQYLKMICPETSGEEKLRIKISLETYCEKDTFAMYAILKKLWRVL